MPYDAPVDFDDILSKPTAMKLRPEDENKAAEEKAAV